jgi:hypothetical protein
MKEVGFMQSSIQRSHIMRSDIHDKLQGKLTHITLGIAGVFGRVAGKCMTVFL